MSDVEPLMSRMRLLSSPHNSVAHAGRMLNADSPRASLIAEIEETQLPRLLVFTNDRAETISCFVRAGRLLSIEHVDASGESHFFGVSDLPNAHRANFSEQVQTSLECFLNNIKSLMVRSQRSELKRSFDQDERYSLSPFEILNPQDDGGSTPLSPLAHFSVECRSLVDAFVVLSGGVFHTLDGDPTLIESLRSVAIVEEANVKAQTSNREDEGAAIGCAIYSGHPAGGRSVFCATQSGVLFLAAFKSEKTGELVALWQSCLEDLEDLFADQ